MADTTPEAINAARPSEDGRYLDCRSRPEDGASPTSALGYLVRDGYELWPANTCCSEGDPSRGWSDRCDPQE